MKELNQFYQKDTTSEKSFYDDFESGCQMSANNKNSTVEYRQEIAENQRFSDVFRVHGIGTLKISMKWVKTPVGLRCLPAITFSKLTMETLEQDVKYVQS